MPKVPDKLITFVIGSACSGKSTLSGYLGRKGHGVTFRASQHLDDYVKKNFKGKTLSDFIGPDYLAHIPKVDDAELLCNGIVEFVSTHDKVIVDGYPRSLHQMFVLYNMMPRIREYGHIIRVINLIVPLNELLERMHKRGRVGDTESRILSEIEIHNRISKGFRDMATHKEPMGFIEFVVPDGTSDLKIQRDFTKAQTGKMQEVSALDSIARRVNDIFCNLEFKQKEGFAQKIHAVNP